MSLTVDKIFNAKLGKTLLSYFPGNTPTVCYQIIIMMVENSLMLPGYMWLFHIFDKINMMSLLESPSFTLSTHHEDIMASVRSVEFSVNQSEV